MPEPLSQFAESLRLVVDRIQRDGVTETALEYLEAALGYMSPEDQSLFAGEVEQIRQSYSQSQPKNIPCEA